MFKITFSKNADKALRRMPRNNAVLIANKIKELASDQKKMRNINIKNGSLKNWEPQ